jgi:hypothetical protein
MRSPCLKHVLLSKSVIFPMKCSKILHVISSAFKTFEFIKKDQQSIVLLFCCPILYDNNEGKCHFLQYLLNIKHKHIFFWKCCILLYICTICSLPMVTVQPICSFVAPKSSTNKKPFLYMIIVSCFLLCLLNPGKFYRSFV